MHNIGPELLLFPTVMSQAVVAWVLANAHKVAG
jgi:hypothetical protein